MKDSLSRRSEGGTSGDRFHVHYKATELYFFQQYCSTFAERLLVRNTVLLYWSDSSIFGDCNHHVKDSLGRCLVDETENSIQKCTSMAVQSSVISRAHFDSHEHFYDHYKNTWLSSFLLSIAIRHLEDSLIKVVTKQQILISVPPNERFLGT